MCFKTYILKREVNNKQLEITRSFDLDNLICTATEILKDNEIDLIIIDDFGTEKGLNENQTGWRAEKIYNLIDTRYRSERPLIISTNLNFNEREEKCEITEKFSTQGHNRIRDRIVDMCFPVQITGKSRRGMTQEKFKEFIT